MSKININNLKVDNELYNFVNQEVIPGLDINVDKFWSGLSNAVHELAPINK